MGRHGPPRRIFANLRGRARPSVQKKLTPVYNSAAPRTGRARAGPCRLRRLTARRTIDPRDLPCSPTILHPETQPVCRRASPGMRQRTLAAFMPMKTPRKQHPQPRALPAAVKLLYKRSIPSLKAPSSQGGLSMDVAFAAESTWGLGRRTWNVLLGYGFSGISIR